jgi:hypothetical protein
MGLFEKAAGVMAIPLKNIYLFCFCIFMDGVNLEGLHQSLKNIIYFVFEYSGRVDDPLQSKCTPLM